MSWIELLQIEDILILNIKSEPNTELHHYQLQAGMERRVSDVVDRAAMQLMRKKTYKTCDNLSLLSVL